MAREKQQIKEQQPLDAVQIQEEEKMYASIPIIGRKPSSEDEEKFLREILEYEFYNSEEPGASLTFPYGSTKHKKVFTLRHGEKYRLPRHVARHLEACSTPLYKWEPNGTGQMIKKKIGIKSRFQMRPVFV